MENATGFISVIVIIVILVVWYSRREYRFVTISEYEEFQRHRSPGGALQYRNTEGG